MDGIEYLRQATKRFEEARAQSERALAQVPFERWGDRLDPGSNSLTTLVLHVGGNLRSRWTDFLTSDGEKPDRDRDAEFEDAAALSREALVARWDAGWSAVLGALGTLRPEDLGRTITIRGEPLGVIAAIQRSQTHCAYHAGQIVFLAKHLAGPAWDTLSVPRGAGASATFTTAHRARHEGR